MARKKFGRNGVIRRIDQDLAKQLEEFAKKNDMSMRQASKEMARINKNFLQGKKISKDIKI